MRTVLLYTVLSIPFITHSMEMVHHAKHTSVTPHATTNQYKSSCPYQIASHYLPKIAYALLPILSTAQSVHVTLDSNHSITPTAPCCNEGGFILLDAMGTIGCLGICVTLCSLCLIKRNRVYASTTPKVPLNTSTNDPISFTTWYSITTQHQSIPRELLFQKDGILDYVQRINER
jgi:hypothetical protein